MHHRFFGSIFVASVALFGASLFAAAATHAAAVPTAAGTVHRATINQTAPVAGTYSGTVKQNGPTLVTHDNEGDRTLVVQSGATVLRNGKAVAISALKKGDKLTATLAANGTVQRIDAKSSSSNTAAIVGIIVLVALVLIALAVAAWLLSSRRRDRDAADRSDRPGYGPRGTAI
jgi:hypothetical protein